MVNVSVPDCLQSKSPKSCKSNRVIYSRAACTGQRFLLSPWKYKSLKVAICSCTRICCHFSACALIFSMCPSVCMRLNKKAGASQGASVVLDSGFRAGYLCWIKCVWIYKWRSYHKSTWGAKLGQQSGRDLAVGARMSSDKVHRGFMSGWCSLTFLVMFDSFLRVVESVNNPLDRWASVSQISQNLMKKCSACRKHWLWEASGQRNRIGSIYPK